MSEYGLGRLPALDSRDKGFLLARPATMPSGIRFWYDRAFWGDQGNLPHCVGYAWTHVLEDAPVARPGPVPFHDPSDIYRQAQEVDEWPGSSYEGTSVRAGAKVCQSLGYLSSYQWAFDLETVVAALLTRGPVVIGSSWHESMFNTVRRRDAQGRYRQFLHIEPGSPVVGGHAWVINGVNTSAKICRAKNSWSQSWGSNGRAAISFDTLRQLIDDSGEACLPVEK